MLVGVLSDTHGVLPSAAFAELADCDFIVHAGDICGPGILAELETLAPVTAVLGNNDCREYGRSVKPVRYARYRGRAFTGDAYAQRLAARVARVHIGAAAGRSDSSSGRARPYACAAHPEREGGISCEPSGVSRFGVASARRFGAERGEDLDRRRRGARCAPGRADARLVAPFERKCVSTKRMNEGVLMKLDAAEVQEMI